MASGSFWARLPSNILHREMLINVGSVYLDPVLDCSTVSPRLSSERVNFAQNAMQTTLVLAEDKSCHFRYTLFWQFCKSYSGRDFFDLRELIKRRRALLNLSLNPQVANFQITCSFQENIVRIEQNCAIKNCEGFYEEINKRGINVSVLYSQLYC